MCSIETVVSLSSCPFFEAFSNLKNDGSTTLRKRSKIGVAYNHTSDSTVSVNLEAGLGLDHASHSVQGRAEVCVAACCGHEEVP